jgi:chaperonin GroEL
LGKQIQFDDAARESLRRGAEQFAGALRVTLGPRGRNVVIDHGDGAPIITNDGRTIAREIELADPFENMGVQLLREAALRTGETAGDGITTAAVLGSTLVARGLEAVAEGHRPAAVRRGIDRAVRAVVAELRRQSRPLRTSEDVARLASICAGDDGEIGRLVADAMDRVGPHGVITVGDGPGLDLTLDVLEGVRFEGGYLSPYFVTDADDMEAALDDAYVLIADFRITAAAELMPVLERSARSGRPLLVVAEDVEGEALATLVVNRLRGTLPSVAVRTTLAGERRRDLLDDLATLTGARLFTRDAGASLGTFDARDFGRARRVRVDSTSTTLVEGGGDAAEIRERIAGLREAVATCEVALDREWLEHRLARLAGGIAVIRVGAGTESGRLERRTRIEESLAATRAAIEEGVVPGGGVALLRAQRAVGQLGLDGDEAVGAQIVLHVLEQPAFQIAENAGADGGEVVDAIRRRRGAVGFDAVGGRLCNLDRQGILDPAKVTRCALENAASIGALVLTTDAIVVDAPADEKSAEMEEPEEDEGEADEE